MRQKRLDLTWKRLPQSDRRRDGMRPTAELSEPDFGWQVINCKQLIDVGNSIGDSHECTRIIAHPI